MKHDKTNTYEPAVQVKIYSLNLLISGFKNSLSLFPTPLSSKHYPELLQYCFLAFLYAFTTYTLVKAQIQIYIMYKYMCMYFARVCFHIFILNL